MLIIIGAGISGLTAANNLNKKFVVFEKDNSCGGLSTQYRSEDFWFDYSGHYFHFKNKALIKTYLEKYATFKCYIRKSKTYIFNKYIPFPVQLHLSHLPKNLARRILNEFPETHRTDCPNLEAYIKFNFGEQLFYTFFQPFLDKYYQTDLKKIMATMDKGSIPVPDKKSVIQGFKGKNFDNQGYNPVFWYPKIPLRLFIENMASSIKSHIRLNEEILKIDWKQKKVFTQNASYPYEYIINTMPLNQLLIRMEPGLDLPDPANLKHVSTLVSNVVLKRQRKRFHWAYIPEKKIPFYRVGFYPSRNPPICYLEKSITNPSSITHSRKLVQEISFTLKRLQIIREPDDILYIDHRMIPVSYIIFNLQWGDTIPPTLKKLKKLGIYSIGRYGTWNYSSMSDDVQMAINTTNMINEK
jgi:protoporphyrinogen oxidase